MHTFIWAHIHTQTQAKRNRRTCKSFYSSFYLPITPCPLPHLPLSYSLYSPSHSLSPFPSPLSQISQCHTCPGGYYCPDFATTDPVPCNTTFLCPPRSTNPTSKCPQGFYCPAKTWEVSEERFFHYFLHGVSLLV
jgi:hypothetical protein